MEDMQPLIFASLKMGEMELKRSELNLIETSLAASSDILEISNAAAIDGHGVRIAA
jgi:hypothetical protein